MIHVFRKSFITTYRIASVITWYSLLMFLAGYFALLSFYTLNKSWVAPVLISPSNDKILSLTSQIVASEQTLASLRLSSRTLAASNAEMLQRKVVLLGVNEQFEAAINRQMSDNVVSGKELNRLADQKHSDVVATQTMLLDIDKNTADIQHNLKAGLITRSEAMAQQTTAAQFRNAFTDAEVGEVVLRDNAKQKLNTDVAAVDTITKGVELKSELAQIELTVKANQDTIVNNNIQIQKIEQAISTTRDNPYFVAAQSSKPVAMAFMSFDNQDNVRTDADVYNCYLSFVICRKVGKVVRIFSEEERASNPILKTDMRGTFVQLELSDRESVKSKTLFVGHRPLLF
jgi:hypothetical protein